MRKQYVEITTADTGKTYRYDHNNPVETQLWEVTLNISCVDSKTGRSWYVADVVSPISRAHPPVTIYLERETLENAGLLPVRSASKNDQDEEPTETAEDLLIRLLEHLGYYPTE